MFMVSDVTKNVYNSLSGLSIDSRHDGVVQGRRFQRRQPQEFQVQLPKYVRGNSHLHQELESDQRSDGEHFVQMAYSAPRMTVEIGFIWK